MQFVSPLCVTVQLHCRFRLCHRLALARQPARVSIAAVSAASDAAISAACLQASGTEHPDKTVSCCFPAALPLPVSCMVTEAMLGCVLTQLCLVDSMRSFVAALPPLGAGPSVRYRYSSTSAAKLFLYAAWIALVDIIESRALCGSEALAS